VITYIKELALHIAKLDFSWVPKAFASALTGALQALSQQPL
jgi:hypothetical protein